MNNFKHTHRLFLGLGTNIGDREKNIVKAYDKIEKNIGKIITVSSLFITEPEGFKSNNLFVNSVCEVATNLGYEDVFAKTQYVEKEIGRTEKSHNDTYTDRVIDIDILLYDNLVIDMPHLTIPHARMHERLFVLRPLSEIAPNLIHPKLHQSMQELKIAEEKRRNE